MKSILYQEVMLSKGVYQIRVKNDDLGLPFSQKHQFFMTLITASSIERNKNIDGLKIASIASCVENLVGDQFYKVYLTYNSRKQVVGFTLDYTSKQEGLEDIRINFQDKATFELVAVSTDEDFKLLIKGIIFMAQKQSQMLMEVSRYVS